MYKLIKTNGGARRGEFSTNRGTFQTPAFMNVATAGAIKGGLNAGDLLDIGCQVMLCNTYHLHLRPGDELVRKLGGLHEFTRWNGPILTDSGGFQVFSLAKIRKITEEGISFASHIDGRRVFMSPEDSIRIQSNLGSTIAMALDECIENPSPRDYVERSCARTVRWLERCLSERDNLARDEKAINSEQLLFGINQGGCFSDIRVANMREIADIPCDGYAIGGLAVGESANEMYGIIEDVEPHMPRDKIRYLMGVGTPTNIIEAVARGVDLFDCVMPARNGRHGHIFTWDGVLNLNNAKYENDPRVMDERCSCPVCRAGYTRA
ncbi:MAG: tRNA guanosine(34) transglycosylase Tgt, partial [Oscillospiraceae bacterium]